MNGQIQNVLDKMILFQCCTCLQVSKITYAQEMIYHGFPEDNNLQILFDYGPLKNLQAYKQMYEKLNILSPIL